METKEEGEMLESRLSLEDFVKMQNLFLVGSAEVPGTLTRAEFVEQALSAIGLGSLEEYGQLFDGADVSREGRLPWTAMASFLLLALSEKRGRGAEVAPEWHPPRVPAPAHRGALQQVAYLSGSGRYLTASQEGVLAMWTERFDLQSTHRVATDSVRTRDLWVTGMVVLHNVSKIAISFTCNEICIYDLLSKQEFTCQYKVQGLKHTAVSLDYWFSPQDANQAVLSFGDVGGQVSAIYFRTAQICLFERPSTGIGQGAVVINWTELLEGRHRCCYTIQHQAHGQNWVRRVKFLGNMEALVSCSTGRQSSMVVAWKERERATLRLTVANAGEGANDLDYHAGLNLIATAGVDSKVYLWNPYVVSKPVGFLQGHTASVVAVRFTPARKQLLSFSKDKVLRVWDVHRQLCIQRLAGIFPKMRGCRTLLFYHETYERLFITFKNLITILEARKQSGGLLTSHKHAITCVLYNSYLKQVISSDVGSTVICWLVDTGHKVKRFTQCHGNVEISTMALDDTQTRLFTGGMDGAVKVWDFNGHCHHKLDAGRGRAVEISNILVLKRTVLVLGWERTITVFRRSTFSKFHVQPSEWRGGVQHHDDIISAAFLPPQSLVTGGCDGEITVWNNSTEHALRKLRPDSSLDDGLSTSVLSAAPGGQEDLESSHAVARLFFLEERMSAAATGGADLVSCGGSALVRFWNVTRGCLVAQFVAHAGSSSIVMTVDAQGRYLITGSMDGEVKVWNIQDYCLVPGRAVIQEAPELLSCFWPHTDCVTHLGTCVHRGQLLLLSASVDCRLILSHLPGPSIGTFGQEHWSVDDIRENPQPHSSPAEELQKASSSEEGLLSSPGHPEDTPSKGSPQNPGSDTGLPDLMNDGNSAEPAHLSSWTAAVLESRNKEGRKRRENDGGHLASDGPLASSGTFSNLRIEKLATVGSLSKPEPVPTTPPFGQKLDCSFSTHPQPSATTDTVQVLVSGRTSFPSGPLTLDDRAEAVRLKAAGQSKGEAGTKH